jgi:two-component system C4-dicarboxylate transport sensor histidine kinase DctB
MNPAAPWLNANMTWAWRTLLAWVVVTAAGVWLGYTAAERSGMNSLRAGASQRLDIYLGSLQSELSRFEYLPSVVALNQDVTSLMQAPTDPAQRARANAYLETVSTQAKASAVYLMDRSGMTLAASNWNEPLSFVGMSFSYRPYFQDAMEGHLGRFYGIGTVSREPGYYFSYPVKVGGETVGAIAVKVNLDKQDQAWARSAEKILVADGYGVVFLSSEKDWKFRTLGQISDETAGRLAMTRQYTEAGLLEPVGLREVQWLPDGGVVVQTQAGHGSARWRDASAGPEYLMQSRTVPGTDWKLYVLADLRPTRALARNTAIATALALSFLALLILLFQQRRRNARQAQANRIALQRAHDELERKVELRTEALSDANVQLQAEITERKRAEEILKATLDELVQTGKMAVLGQMSAGITHELNQPLAALRTLSANTIVFLERGDQAHVESNLRVICQLTDHMGKITSQLKKFARKSAVELHPVKVASAISDALFLLDQRLRNEHILFEQSIWPPDLEAQCDLNRLEQVVVNLVSNALDAMQNVTHRRLLIHAQQEGDAVTIEVHDNGSGISDAVAPHLFEPFFTTKDQGVGLGLGLAISAGIVRDFGGTLRAGRSRLGGAVFTIRLKAVFEEIAA